MSKKQEASPTLDMGAMDAAVLDDLTRRVKDIDGSYRAVAQKMGQLYMFADEHKLDRITEMLDKPMRNASDNEQAFAGIVEEIRMFTNSRGAVSTEGAESAGSAADAEGKA